MLDFFKSQKTWLQAVPRRLNDCDPSHPHPRAKGPTWEEIGMGGGGEGVEVGPGGGQEEGTCHQAWQDPDMDKVEALAKGEKSGCKPSAEGKVEDVKEINITTNVL